MWYLHPMCCSQPKYAAHWAHGCDVESTFNIATTSCAQREQTLKLIILHLDVSQTERWSAKTTELWPARHVSVYGLKQGSPSSCWSRLLSFFAYFISRVNHCYWEWNVCPNIKLFANICAWSKQIWVIFSPLKLWVAVARHNFSGWKFK